MSIADRVLDLFAARGSEEYHGEAVSQLEHAEQCAALAVADGAPETLVAAALLHDIGHLLHDEGEDAAQRGLDTRHEDDGDRWLAQWFPPSVTEPVRLHVAAKRYLCAVDPEYRAALSPASELSLQLQGGPMDEPERAAFEEGPFWGEAVRLRRWDDQAKTPGLEVPAPESYRDLLTRVAGA